MMTGRCPPVDVSGRATIRPMHAVIPFLLRAVQACSRSGGPAFPASPFWRGRCPLRGTLWCMSTNLTREVRFSVDRDWAGRIDPRREPANTWGGFPTAVGIVPHLRLRATIRGTPDAATGYVCNIHEIDRLLRCCALPRIAERLRARGWRERAEGLIAGLWAHVAAEVPSGTSLIALELVVTPTLSFTVCRENPAMVRVTQQFEFSAAHRLHCPQLSDEENRRIFGKCNHPSGHGHNYVVEVTVGGEPDPQTGRVFPLPRLERIVHERVIERLDHKHLNVDVAEFARLNPSVENIARVIHDWLAEAFKPATLLRVRVYETPRTWADYPADEGPPTS